MILDVSNENPWWNSGGLWQDPDLKRVRSSLLRYRPGPIKVEDLSGNPVLTLRGPRRVGKTVAIKLLIANLIEEQGWRAKDIVWTTFETIRTLNQAEDILVEIAKKRKPRLIAIDEVTSLIGWQKVVKKLRDNGTLDKSAMILTGSSAYDLKAGAERMAGRRGTVQYPDRVLLPMSFCSFVEQCKPLGLPDMDLQKAFLSVGGFPWRVESYLKNPKHFSPHEGLSVLDDVLMYEIARRRLDRSIALELVGRLASIETTAVSFEGLSKSMTITNDTAKKYVNALGDSFLLATIFSYDTARARVALKKDKKFFWIDPSYAFLASHLGQGTEASAASRAEWLVGVELIRRYERRLFEGLSALRNVFTWKSKAGNEIDFLVVDKSQQILLPVEVKYQRSISDWDFQSFERAFKKGILVTIDVSRVRDLSYAEPLHKFLRSP